MAFTPEQETILEQIIEAFQNGKRLSDLPEVQDANPFELICEVLENGESKKAALATLLPYLEQQCAYGVQFDTSVSSAACTRIGNTDLHKSLPIQSRMRGCLLDDNGNVVEYLDPKDWRGQTRDGSRGQVMVEIPLHYRKFETDGTVRRVKISEYPLPGYHTVPKRYVSAYQATVDRTNSKLASVVNNTAQYRGCNNQSNWDETYRSALGRPASSISLTTFRTYARNRKSGSTQWNCHTYGSQKAIYWLFVVEYANLNSQAAYNASKDASGYAQGGLGDGVTNANSTAWNNFNGYNPFVPCGYTDEFGNGSGVKALEVRDGDDALFVSTYVNRYRGIEIPFGHIFHWTDGVLVEAGAESDTNLHKVFVAKDPSKFASSIGDGYAHVGNQARADGYGKEHIFGEGGEIIAAAVGGGSTTYLCDYNYQNIPASGKATRGVLFGGYAHDGAAAGFVSARSIPAPSSASAHLGSRLCFLPTLD